MINKELYSKLNQKPLNKPIKIRINGDYFDIEDVQYEKGDSFITIVLDSDLNI
jgi:hypothetical protein